jgi:hypothetical protein
VTELFGPTLGWLGDGELQRVEEGGQPADRVVAVCGEEYTEFVVDGWAGGAEEFLADGE